MKEADRTDMGYCREIAKHFLYMDVETNHPLGRPFIYHPYAKSEFIIDENGNLNSIVDDADTLDYFRQTILKRIDNTCLLYTSPSPRDRTRSRMPSSA